MYLLAKSPDIKWTSSLWVGDRVSVITLHGCRSVNRTWAGSYTDQHFMLKWPPRPPHTLRFIMKKHAKVNKLFINICLCWCFCELTYTTTSWLSLLCDRDVCPTWHHHCCIWNMSISLTCLTNFITIRMTKNRHLVNVNCELQISQHGGGGA